MKLKTSVRYVQPSYKINWLFNGTWTLLVEFPRKMPVGFIFVCRPTKKQIIKAIKYCKSLPLIEEH